MKKIIALVLITLSATAMAQYPHHNHRRGGWGYNGWIAPVIVSGVIGYEIARNYPPVVVQQPVIIQPAPVPPTTIYYGQSPTCTAWNEIQTADGRIYRERTCTQ
jgi:hypothetical protein